ARRIDVGAHVAAGHRVDLAVEQSPILQPDHVFFVEGAKALLGKLPGRAQLAGAERGERAPGLGDVTLDQVEALLEGERRTQAHAVDGVAGERGGAGGILEHARDEAITAGGEFDWCGKGHGFLRNVELVSVSASRPPGTADTWR